MIASQLTIKTICAADLETLATIDADANTEPWSVDDFGRWLEEMIDHPTQFFGVLATCQMTGQPVGHATWTNHARHISLIECVVAKRWRRHGFATAILRHVAGTLTPMRNKIFALAHERNDDGLAFLLACGFKGIGTTPVDKDEADHYAMQYVHAATLPVSVVDGVTIRR